MSERRRLTTLDKLKIMVRQAVCPLCEEKLGALAGIDFDHTIALALGGEDTLDNLKAVHRDCHKIKTNGTKATSLGSDKHEIAKTRRLEQAREDARRRLLAPDEKPETTKRRWSSRPFPQRRKASA